MRELTEASAPVGSAGASKLEIALALTQLDKKELSSVEIEELARNKSLLRDYRVKRALAFHPHVPRNLALRLIRDLYTTDLMRLALAPAAPADLRTVAEQALIARLSQAALGEKISLARQASARVVSALLIEGHRKVVAPALDNPRLTESQILKVLSKEKIAPSVMTAICHHTKWSSRATVRMALVRHRQTPLDAAAKFLRLMTDAELQTIAALGSISAPLRVELDAELDRRNRAV